MAVETKAEKKNSATFTRFKKQIITIRRQHNTPHRKPVSLLSLWTLDFGAETGNGDRQNGTMVEFRWIQMSSFLTLLLCVSGRDGYDAFRHTGTTSQQTAALLNRIFLQQQRPDSSNKISSSETDVRRFCCVEIRRTRGRSVTASNGRSELQEIPRWCC